AAAELPGTNVGGRAVGGRGRARAVRDTRGFRSAHRPNRSEAGRFPTATPRERAVLHDGSVRAELRLLLRHALPQQPRRSASRGLRRIRARAAARGQTVALRPRAAPGASTKPGRLPGGWSVLRALARGPVPAPEPGDVRAGIAQPELMALPPRPSCSLLHG